MKETKLSKKNSKSKMGERGTGKNRRLSTPVVFSIRLSRDQSKKPVDRQQKYGSIIYLAVICFNFLSQRGKEEARPGFEHRGSSGLNHIVTSYFINSHHIT